MLAMLVVLDTLSLATGQIGADLSSTIQLDRDRTFDTVTLAPDLWLGVGHDITVGIVHSDANLDRIRAESSICIHRQHAAYPGLCDRAYHSAGLDVRWRATAHIAPRARLLLRGVDPYKPAATVGLLGHWDFATRFAIDTDPYLRIGLANTNRGNRVAIVLPVYLSVQLAAWNLAFHTGYDSELATWTDGFHIPAALRVRRAIDAHLDVSLEAGFSSGVGPQNTSSSRAAIVMLRWRS